MGLTAYLIPTALVLFILTAVIFLRLLAEYAVLIKLITRM